MIGTSAMRFYIFSYYLRLSDSGGFRKVIKFCGFSPCASWRTTHFQNPLHTLCTGMSSTCHVALARAAKAHRGLWNGPHTPRNHKLFQTSCRI